MLCAFVVDPVGGGAAAASIDHDGNDDEEMDGDDADEDETGDAGQLTHVLVEASTAALMAVVSGSDYSVPHFKIELTTKIVKRQAKKSLR